MLHGRAAELADIHGLLADARGGRSSLLVVQGEAGSGKTALLEHVAADAKDFRVHAGVAKPPPARESASAAPP